MINKLLNIFSKNKKSIFFILFFVFAFFAFSDISFANESGNLLDDETKEKVVEAISWIGSVIVVFLSILTYLGVMFLSPEWINGSLFGLNSYFKDIWILVSNVVYFIFAFILIWIAFMNIIGKGQDKYQLKQALPKFLIGILIVPLSWFIVNFILSISAILTIAAINLPFDTFQGFDSKISDVQIPLNCTIDLTKESGEADADGKTPAKKYFDCIDSEEGGKTQSLGIIMEGNNSSSKIFGVLGTYAYGVLGLENVDQISNFEIETIKTIGDLVVKIVFDVLFIVVYAILMIALALVLMTRGIYIWIYLMISPVFGLMYFFDKSSGGGEFFDKFNIKQFISLAMVPVYTMLALTFGLLFIFVVGEGMVSGNTSNSFGGFQGVSIKSNDDNESSTLTIGGSEDADKQFKLTIKGAAANEDTIAEIWERFKTEGNGGLGVIGTLIMKIFGIVILWGAVMAALRSNDVTKAVVEPLHAFGSQVGQLAAKSPQYMPIFGGQSMKGIEQMGNLASSHYETKARSTGSNFLEKHSLFGQGGQDVNLSQNSINALTQLNSVGLQKQTAESYRDLIKNHGSDLTKLNRNQNFIELTRELAEKLGLEGSDKVKTGMNLNDLSRIIGQIDYSSQTGANNFKGGVDILEGYDNNGVDLTHSRYNEIVNSNNGNNQQNTGGTNNQQDNSGNVNQTVNLNIGTTDTPTITLGENSNMDDIYRQVSNLDFSNITESDFSSNLLSVLNSNNVNNAPSVVQGIIDKLKEEGKTFKN